MRGLTVTLCTFAAPKPSRRTCEPLYRVTRVSQWINIRNRPREETREAETKRKTVPTSVQCQYQEQRALHRHAAKSRSISKITFSYDHLTSSASRRPLELPIVRYADRYNSNIGRLDVYYRTPRQSVANPVFAKNCSGAHEGLSIHFCARHCRTHRVVVFSFRVCLSRSLRSLFFFWYNLVLQLVAINHTHVSRIYSTVWCVYITNGRHKTRDRALVCHWWFTWLKGIFAKFRNLPPRQLNVVTISAEGAIRDFRPRHIEDELCKLIVIIIALRFLSSSL